MCSDCKRSTENGGGCTKSVKCDYFVSTDLPDYNPAKFSKSLKHLKRVENPLQRNINS